MALINLKRGTQLAFLNSLLLVVIMSSCFFSLLINKSILLILRKKIEKQKNHSIWSSLSSMILVSFNNSFMTQASMLMSFLTFLAGDVKQTNTFWLIHYMHIKINSKHFKKFFHYEIPIFCNQKGKFAASYYIFWLLHVFQTNAFMFRSWVFLKLQVLWHSLLFWSFQNHIDNWVFISVPSKISPFT